MKMDLNHTFVGAHGKLCKKEGTYAATFSQNGLCYMAFHHKQENQTYTEAQTTAQTKMKTRSQAAAAWWKENKPSKTNEDGTELYQTIVKEFKAQTRYQSAYVYFLSKIDKNMKVEIGSTTVDLSTGTSSSDSGTTTPTNPSLS